MYRLERQDRAAHEALPFTCSVKLMRRVAELTAPPHHVPVRVWKYAKVIYQSDTWGRDGRTTAAPR